MRFVDESTLAAARRGDRDAQARLLRDYQDSWYRLCLSQLRDPHLALDATQETALRFLRQLPQFRGDSQLRTWSLGIAINVVREIRRGRRRAADLDDAQCESANAAQSPESMAQQAESAGRLHAMLAQLPDRQREVVILRYFEELSTEQTAATMNYAVGTVKATLHQALRSLREKLKQRV